MTQTASPLTTFLRSKAPLLSGITTAAALALTLGAPYAAAEVKLAPLFSDGAVLQQKKPVTVWGLADAGEKVEISFAGQTVRTVADKDGRWSVSLQPLQASSTPQTLSAKGNNTVKIDNVLVGEVWLCSGQSNMEWDVKRSNNAASEIRQATYPLIRQIKLKHTPADFPMNEAAAEWITCSPETVGDFTAVGYFFALTIYNQLGIPVGLINSSWGGTQIESWIEAETLAKTSSSDIIQQRWQERLSSYPAEMENYNKNLATWQAQRAKAQSEGKPFNRRAPRKPEGPGSRWQPSSLFNGMIAPLAPYTIAGTLWYQGEANAERYSEYAELFKAMIQQWRTTFGQADLPFYFVQLANFTRKSDETGNQWAFLREAQAAALELPNTGMAVTIDIGNPSDIHPRNKQDVGNRLALLALRDIYGHSLIAEGPRFKEAKFNGIQAEVSFSNAEGLNSDNQPLGGFLLAGSDKKFYPANATIKGDKVIVTSEQVSAPVAVRYAWENNPATPATLRNAAQLPAEPFRSDKW